MTRIFRRVACGGLLALALSLPPSPATANGFGLFGARPTAYLDTVETYYSLPVATSYVVPTTAVVSSSYLLPTSSVVYRPARYSLSPTIYRPIATSYLSSSILPTSYRVLPTRYVVGGSVLSPTRYYLGDVVSSAYYPTSTVFASSYAYDVPVVASSPTVYVDRPVVSSAPAVTSTPRSQPQPPPQQQEPPLEQNRQQANPPGTGRAPVLENPPIDPRPAEPAQPAPAERLEPESPTPPDLPTPEDNSIEGIMPLPEPFEMRQSQRPAFGGGLPGPTVAAVSRMIQGRVRDEQDGRPVSGALVSFSNTAMPGFNERRAETDANGQFRLAEFLPDGDWSIVVTGDGDGAPTRTYPQITVMGGRIYDRLGRDYSKLLLDY